MPTYNFHLLHEMTEQNSRLVRWLTTPFFFSDWLVREHKCHARRNVGKAIRFNVIIGKTSNDAGAPNMSNVTHRAFVEDCEISEESYVPKASLRSCFSCENTGRCWSAAHLYSNAVRFTTSDAVARGVRLPHRLQMVMECGAKRSWKVQHSSMHPGLEVPAPVSSFSPSLLLRWVIVLEASGSTL